MLGEEILADLRYPARKRRDDGGRKRARRRGRIRPGVAVAAITKRNHGFVGAHVEGSNKPTLNGASISAEPVTLKNGDLLELAGTQMQFVQA